MAFSLGKRLKATRESLGLTQEQVIEQLENRYGITLSQLEFLDMSTDTELRSKRVD